VPSDSAHEEISRVAEFTQKFDARVNWSALMHMSDLPVALLICVDGGAFFKAENLINWDHADGIYGWSALKPNTPNEHPVMLEGDHFQAYSTQANISAISRSIAAGIERAESGNGNSKKLSEYTSDGEKESDKEGKDRTTSSFQDKTDVPDQAARNAAIDAAFGSIFDIDFQFGF